MPVQRSSCYNIVKKTVPSDVLNELTTHQKAVIYKMHAEDRSTSKVKNFVERLSLIHIAKLETKFLRNCGGKEAHIVGVWAEAAAKATKREILRKIAEHENRQKSLVTRRVIRRPADSLDTSSVRDKATKAGGVKRQCTSRAAKGGVKAGTSGRFSGLDDVDSDDPFGDDPFGDDLFDDDSENEGNGVSSDGKGVRPLSGMPRGLGLKRGGRNLQAGPSSGVKENAGQKKSLAKDSLANVPRRSFSSGVRGSLSSGVRKTQSVSRSSEFRTVSSGGVKKVKKFNPPTPSAQQGARNRQPAAMKSEECRATFPNAHEPSPGSSKASSSCGALIVKRETAARTGASSGGSEKKNCVQKVKNQIEALHSQNKKKVDIVNLYKIAGHALICHRNSKMDVTAMDDEEYNKWSKDFYDWAGGINQDEEGAEIAMLAQIFMAIPLENLPQSETLWHSNWEALGGNQLDANPRRTGDILDGIEGAVKFEDEDDDEDDSKKPSSSGAAFS